MNKEEIQVLVKQMIMEGLSVEVNHHRDFYSKGFEVVVSFNDEVVSRDEFPLHNN